LPEETASRKVGSIRVLLVDDDETQAELAKLNLEDVDPSITITTVLKPSDTLRLLRSQSFDCIVSDYQMPEMNGIQFCAEVRKTSNIPFIIFTGHGSEEIASAAFSVGIDDYVRKEESLAHYQLLARRIMHAVEKMRAEKGLRQIVNQLETDRGLLNSVVEHAPVGINLVRGSDLTYQLVNSFYQVIAPGKEMLGRSIRDVWPEIYPQLEEVYNHVLQTGETHHAVDEKFNIKRSPDGPLEEAFFSWSLIRVPLPSGEGWGVLNTMIETTEGKRSEEETRRLSAAVMQENVRLSALVNSIQDEVWFADAEKKFTLANPSALKEFGITSAESGIDIEKMALNLEVFRPDGSPRPIEEAPPLRALRGEVITRQEEIVKTPASGELRYRSVSSTPVKDADGKIIGSVSVVRDITTRKRAEEALRESEQRYRMIFDRGQMGIAVSDLNGYLLITNPAFQKILGYTESELQNKNFRELTLDTDLPEENKCVSELIEGKRDGYNIEKRYIRKDGETIWVELASSVLRDAEGKPAFGVAMVQNINDKKTFEEALRESNLRVQDYANRLEGLVAVRTTELRESEERLRNTFLYTRSLIEASLDPLVTISAEGKITDVNEATIHVTGVSREDLIGSDFSDYFTNPEEAKAGYRRVFEEGYVRDYPLTIRHKTGELTDVLYNATVYRSSNGEIAGIFAAARDITDRRKLEERLQRTEVVAAVEQMGATVAHDLRGPLGQIVQSIQMAKKDPSLTPRMLQLAEINAVRSLKMIADWRSSTREMVPQPVKTDLGLLVKSILDGSTFPPNVEIVTSIGEGLTSVKLDPDIMHRVIDNLVKNAVEAMPEGGRLFVKAEKGVAEVVVSVGDTGMGIPEESRWHIFSPLYTTKVGGMGLGLTYCRRAVEAQGGSIDFESKIGVGTTFTVKLPINLK